MVDTAAKMGRITHSPALDVEFSNGELSKMYNALIIENDDASLTCEIQQLLGNNEGRAVSRTSTDGMV